MTVVEACVTMEEHVLMVSTPTLVSVHLTGQDNIVFRMLMSVLSIILVSTMEHAETLKEDTSASVSMALLATIVRSIKMTVPSIHVSMVEPVLTRLANMNVSVHLVKLVSFATLMTSVTSIPASQVPDVTPTWSLVREHAHVLLVSRVRTVMKILTSVPTLALMMFVNMMVFVSILMDPMSAIVNR